MTGTPDRTETDVPDSGAAAAAGAAEDADVTVGTLAEYDVGPEIARGGAGRILQAWDRKLQREVALKVPLPGHTQARLAREAMLTAQLEHPAIVPVHAAGQQPDGTTFYVMKLLAGRSLNDVIAGTSTLDERIALLPVAIAVCDAIA